MQYVQSQVAVDTCSCMGGSVTVWKCHSFFAHLQKLTLFSGIIVSELETYLLIVYISTFPRTLTAGVYARTTKYATAETDKVSVMPVCCS